MFSSQKRTGTTNGAIKKIPAPINDIAQYGLIGMEEQEGRGVLPV
jgi:hypothetical protein